MISRNILVYRYLINFLVDWNVYYSKLKAHKYTLQKIIAYPTTLIIFEIFTPSLPTEAKQRPKEVDDATKYLFTFLSQYNSFRLKQAPMLEP